MSRLDDVRDSLSTDNHVLWLFVAVSVATLVTLQTIESAIETAWPHSRRPSSMLPGERRAVPIWGVVGLLVLPGAILSLMTLGVMMWRDVDYTRTQSIGAILLTAGWVVFFFASLDWFGFGRAIKGTGIVGPLAIGVIILVADVLLLIGFVDIVPEISDVVDAVRDWFPSLN
ncbi:MAG: hypothetical protein ACRDHN_18225 [Thermomicrobiales bacterium]